VEENPDDVTEEEIRNYLLTVGKIKSGLLVQKFKNKLKEEDKKNRFFK
jgi:hypothetical protein